VNFKKKILLPRIFGTHAFASIYFYWNGKRAKFSSAGKVRIKKTNFVQEK
jgi:hypothetical protein